MLFFRCRFFVAFWIFFLPVFSANASNAKLLFEQYHDRIYQIRLIEIESGNKSALGSGFQITETGILATNFHVVADAIHDPERYRIEFVDHAGATGLIEILDIDVINDLALIKRSPMEEASFIPLTDVAPKQGEDVFSLGNPHDLGMTVVPGTYNGVVAHSFYNRMLFSGSINPGMSGGPSLNAAGRVIGINVATAGNQLSFLVPVSKLKILLSSLKTRGNPEAQNLKVRIQEQLLANQKSMMSVLLLSEWPVLKLGEANVIGEISDYIRCWGAPNDNRRVRYKKLRSNCANDEYIYLSSHFSTGGIQYEFSWLETDELKSTPFYNGYQENIKNASSINWAREEDVGPFKCHEDFVAESEQPMIIKAVICARAYKQYEGLYDVLYIGATVHEKQKGLVSHFSIAGVDKVLGLEFARKFMKQVSWASLSK